MIECKCCHRIVRIAAVYCLCGALLLSHQAHEPVSVRAPMGVTITTPVSGVTTSSGGTFYTGR